MLLNHLNLRAKLTAGFIVIAGIVLVVSILAALSLSRSNQRLLAYAEGVGVKSQAAAELQGAAARRALAVRNMVLTADAEATKRLGEVAAAEHAATNLALTTLKRLVLEGQDQGSREGKIIRDIDRIETQYGPIALAIVKLAVEGQRDQATQRINRECLPLLEELVRTVDEFLKYEAQTAKQMTAASVASFHQDRWLLIVAALAAVAAALGLGVTLSNIVTRPLQRAIAVAETVAAGNLTTDIRSESRDETGQLMNALSRMNAGLLSLVTQIRQSADSISNASREISTGNQDLSSRTETQASALQETAASLQQMTSTVQQTAQSSRQAAQLARSATEVAARGGDVVERVIATMGEISGASRRIADIIGVIDSIAFQTNILALNAAVEAARAGEQGRGFAVVASEVRTLAGRSAEAAREIKRLIQASAEKVDAGSSLVGEAGTTMGEIVSQVARMAALMTEIDAATTEQSGGIVQVNQAVASIDQGTQQNAALVEQSAAAAESLQQQASGLIRIVGQFKTMHA